MYLLTLALLTVPSFCQPASPALEAAAAPTPSVSPVLRQDDEDEKPDKRPEIKALLSELAGHVKQKGKEDEQAIALIDKLVQEFPESGPKDRKSIADAVGKTLSAKRKIELEPGVPDDRLHMAAAVSLRMMGPESVKTLIGSIDHKSLKDNLRLQRELILSLGKTKDPSGVDPLLDLLKHSKPEMQAAGAEALGEHAKIEQETRKEIVNDLIKIMMGQKTRVDSSPTDQEARSRWDMISGPIVASLQLLTGHDERDPDAWQRWWNKNKKEDWDAEK